MVSRRIHDCPEKILIVSDGIQGERFLFENEINENWQNV